jgi:hypothetical protein
MSAFTNYKHHNTYTHRSFNLVLAVHIIQHTYQKTVSFPQTQEEPLFLQYGTTEYLTLSTCSYYQQHCPQYYTVNIKVNGE